MFNVYGPGQDLTNLRQGMVSIFLAQAITDHKIVVKGSLERYRDFIYIHDVIEAWYQLAFLENYITPIVNLGTGRKTTILDLITAISSVIPCELFSASPTPGDQFGIYADTSLLRQLLPDISFTPLSDGLKIFADSILNPTL